MTPAEIQLLDTAIKNEAFGLYGTYGRAKIISLLGITSDEVSIFVNNGFFDFIAIPVSHDEAVVYRYYSLNDRWRGLKKCGSYAAFVEWEQQEILEEQRRKDDADLYLKYQAENALWQNTLNPLIKESNESTIVTNRYIRIANRNLIIIFLITALISCGSFLISAVNMFRNTRVERLTKQLDEKDATIKAQERILKKAQQ
jgi:hypothetical protein